MHRALGIGVLVIVASFGALFAAAPPARAANVYLHLYASTAGWSNTSGTETNPGPTIVTNSTDVVTLNLTSDDGQPHTFLLDYNGNNNSQPWEPTSSTFSVTGATLVFSSAPPGRYFYICEDHGWDNMRGVWVVRGPPVNDTTPPVIASVSVDPPSPIVNDTVTITASVTDADTGVANVSAHVVGPSFDQNLTMTSTTGATWSVSRVFTQAGTYTVTVWARDINGNNASHVETFTVSTVSPPPDGTPSDNTGLWAAIAAVVILFFLLLAFAMWRRGAKKVEPPRKEEPPET